MALFANYGVTDRLDVGVAIPILRVNIDATVDATVLRLATGETGRTSTIHTFGNGVVSRTFSESGNATGVGDILLRAKYNFLPQAGGGLAGAIDLRVPTGDEQDLLGTGATQAKLLLIGSSAYGNVSPHFNIGYTFTGKTALDEFKIVDELNYSGGVELAASPKVTIVGDLIGRTLRDAGRLRETDRVFNFRTVAGVTGSQTFQEFSAEGGNLNLILGAAGVKFNPAGTC